LSHFSTTITVEIMEGVKALIIYYSSTGANYQLARWAEEGAKIEGAEVKFTKVKETAPESSIKENAAWEKNYRATIQIPETTVDDLDWADAIIFSAPTRYGVVASQVRTFIDTTGSLWVTGKLSNKVVSAMSSAINTHGGQEATILGLYTTMFHWGAIVAAPGYTDPILFYAGGNPYGVSVSVDYDGKIKEDPDIIKKAVQYQAKRTVSVAKWIKKGELQEA
jgi:NAD(P)H dehydrogenase (quinone)